ncbi:ABC transporter substrate-binding protein [Thioalkalicoccus limnaeus]|uniref:ABC transporter substrate-binding protein n=1 Tax=Thioalkalicoccus limnaeus TaxID=120681 RepID=A0ABV4BGN1_9GAMM
MSRRHALPLSTLILGVVLVAATPWIPGGTRLIPTDLPTMDHVTALVGDGGSLFAATQAGEIWRYREHGWERYASDPQGRAITALLGDPRRTPVGTAVGLWVADGEILAREPPISARISAMIVTEQALVLATGEGLRIHTEGAWHDPSPPLRAYQLYRQRGPGIDHIHAGTIGDGIHGAPTTRLLGDWSPNDSGLPADIKVLSFAETPGGRLLAGTDRGLYWQRAPGAIWQVLDVGLGTRRILALHHDRGDDTRQRLWIGSDEGLFVAELSDDAQGELAASEPARPIPAHRAPPEVGVGWIVATDGRLFVSAGQVYQVTTVPLRDRYLLTVAGAGLIGVGLWLALRRRLQRTARI